MAKITTNTYYPSGYDSSNTTATQIASSYPLSNAYTSSASSTYTQISGSSSNNGTVYVSFTFDLSSIPSNAVIESVECYTKSKLSSTSTTRTSSFVVQLYNGSTAMGSSVSIGRVTANTTSVLTDTGTWTRSTIDNLELRFTHTKGSSSGGGSSRNNSVYMRIYGADLVVNYYVPYTITTTISKGVLIAPTEPTMIVYEGDSFTLSHSGNPGQVLKSVTVDGTEVESTLIQSGTTRQPAELTYTASTNMSTYQSYNISNIIDDDEDTFFWSQESQAEGQYILLEMSDTAILQDIATISTGSSTDYPQSNCCIQISTDNSTWETIATYADGEQNQSFSGINKSCRYIRWYITSGTNWWFVLNEVQLYCYYNVEVEEHYEHEITNVTKDMTVNIEYWPLCYAKKSPTEWIGISQVFKKENDEWVECNIRDFYYSAHTYNFTNK